VNDKTRKSLVLGIIISLLFLSMFGSVGFVSATEYTGETPTELTGDYEGWVEIKFLQSGNFSIPDGVSNVEVLVVAGGGGSGKHSTVTYQNAGGGGGGGLVWMYGWYFVVVLFMGARDAKVVRSTVRQIGR
jgi:hypothetical protein